MTAHSGILPARPMELVEDDISCIHCGYNLRTLRLDGVCPECGSPVSLTVRVDLLRFADPRWVENLAAGTRWILNSTGLAAIVALLVTAVMLGSSTDIQGISLWFRNAILCLGILIIPGCLQITAPEPGRRESRQQSFARWSARTGMIVMCSIWLIFTRGFGMPLPGVNPLALGKAFGKTVGPDAKIAWAMHQFVGFSNGPMPVQGMHYLIGIIGWFAMLTYVRQLAMRLPDPHLARQTNALKWGLVASTLLITCVRCIPFGTGAAAVATIITGFGGAAVASAISAVWLFILLLRYRRRFSEAAVQAHAWSSRQQSLAQPQVHS